ncbi:MAG TPA: nitroreductase family protein [candidate division Zixibacteria bacterium]|nr:nitroreductase family protein [candidate division Zixibacteria bacterium]
MSSEPHKYEDKEKAAHIFETIVERRSIRSFTDKPLALDDLKKLVTAARWAPSGSNRQPYKYVIISDPEILEKVIMVSPLLRGIPTAAILICVEKATGPAMDVGFPAQNVLLAAHALGIGSCAIAGFSHTAIRKILDIPEALEPTLLISLGYAADVPKPWPRRPWSETVFLDSCNNPCREE